MNGNQSIVNYSRTGTAGGENCSEFENFIWREPITKLSVIAVVITATRLDRSVYYGNQTRPIRVSLKHLSASEPTFGTCIGAPQTKLPYQTAQTRQYSDWYLEFWTSAGAESDAQLGAIKHGCTAYSHTLNTAETRTRVNVELKPTKF